MKKLKLNIFAILSIASLTFLVSCGSGSKSSKDIEVDKLETACDFVSAMKTCAEEAIALKGDNESPDDFSEEDKAKGMELMQKIQEIQKAAMSKEIAEEDFKACPEFEETEKLLKDMF